MERLTEGRTKSSIRSLSIRGGNAKPVYPILTITQRLPSWLWIPIESFEIGIGFHVSHVRRINTFSRSHFLRVSRYGSILNLDRIAIRGREGELLRTYLITGRNESKPVIYDFNGEAEEFDSRSHQSEGTEEAARRSPRARRRLASSSEHQIS